MDPAMGLKTVPTAKNNQYIAYLNSQVGSGGSTLDDDRLNGLTLTNKPRATGHAYILTVMEPWLRVMPSFSGTIGARL